MNQHDLLLKINSIINDPSITDKVKRNLLRHLGLEEVLVLELVPKDSEIE